MWFKRFGRFRTWEIGVTFTTWGLPFYLDFDVYFEFRVLCFYLYHND